MPKAFVTQDKYFQKAKQEGYLARSAFKLLEINEKFKLFRKGQSVLDLGSAPGSWLQVETPLANKVIGIDLQTIDWNDRNLETHQVDICNFEELQEVLGKQKFDVITADLAPKTSGIRDIDQYHSVELNLAVLKIASRYLKAKGKLVTKVFVGADFQDMLKQFKQEFKHCKNFKPKATRDRSFETYLICSN